MCVVNWVRDIYAHELHIDSGTTGHICATVIEMDFDKA